MSTQLRSKHDGVQRYEGRGARAEPDQNRVETRVDGTGHQAQTQKKQWKKKQEENRTRVAKEQYVDHCTDLAYVRKNDRRHERQWRREVYTEEDKGPESTRGKDITDRADDGEILNQYTTQTIDTQDWYRAQIKEREIRQTKTKIEIKNA